MDRGTNGISRYMYLRGAGQDATVRQACAGGHVAGWSVRIRAVENVAGQAVSEVEERAVRDRRDGEDAMDHAWSAPPPNDAQRKAIPPPGPAQATEGHLDPPLVTPSWVHAFHPLPLSAAHSCLRSHDVTPP